MVSDEAWNQFFSEIVVPRFPTGLTVLEALGRSGTNPGPLTRTRILVVVHPNEQSVEKRLREIKTEYRKRFGAAGIFHTDQPIQIHPEN